MTSKLPSKSNDWDCSGQHRVFSKRNKRASEEKAKTNRRAYRSNASEAVEREIVGPAPKKRRQLDDDEHRRLLAEAKRRGWTSHWTWWRLLGAVYFHLLDFRDAVIFATSPSGTRIVLIHCAIRCGLMTAHVPTSKSLCLRSVTGKSIHLPVPRGTI